MKTKLLLFFLFFSIINCNSQTREEYYNSGKEKGEYGDYKSAVIYYTKAIEIYPYYYDAYVARGFAKVSLEDYSGAIVDFTKAISFIAYSWNDYNSYYGRGLAKMGIKDYIGAIDDFNKAIELFPKDPNVWTGRGLSKIQFGQKDSGCLDLSTAEELGSSEAYEFIKKFCQNELNYNDINILSEKVTESYKLKNYKEALDLQNKKMAILKNDAKSDDFYLIGKLYYNLSQVETADAELSYNLLLKADTAFGTVLFMQSEQINALFLKAVTQNLIDEYQNPKLITGMAKPYFELYIKKTQQDTEKYIKNRISAFNYLGYYYLVFKDYCKSIIYWEKILAVDSKNEKALGALKDLKGKCE